MTRSKGRPTLRTIVSALGIMSLLLYAIAGPALAAHTIALGPSGIENESDFACEGDYFKIESIGQLADGTHDYTGTTAVDEVAWSANITFDEDTKAITVNSMDPALVSIFVKSGQGNYTVPGPSVPADESISHVAFCLGEAPTPTPTPTPEGTPTPTPTPEGTPTPTPTPEGTPTPTPEATPTPTEPDTATLPTGQSGPPMGGTGNLVLVLIIGTLVAAFLLLRPVSRSGPVSSMPEARQRRR